MQSPNKHMQRQAGILYMIPIELSATASLGMLPEAVFNQIKNVKHMVVESVRTTRRFISKCKLECDIDSIELIEMGKHANIDQARAQVCQWLKDGHDVGVLSEAGCPGIADPGAQIVAEAHRQKFHVVPLVGPSSIILALMASGMNGQNFSFHGYLPREDEALKRKIKSMESDAIKNKRAHLFIVPPFGNNKHLNTILKTCNGTTHLCIASDITGENEFIATHNMNYWRQHQPDLGKIPTIFIIGTTV